MTEKDQIKLKALYEIYEQPMYRIAYAVLKNPEFAEDAVSDAFIRIIEKINKIGEPTSAKMRSYIVVIMKSVAIDYYRKQARFYRRNTIMDEQTFTVPDSNTDIEEHIIESDIKNYVLDELSEDDKKLIVMRCCNDLSWKEVSKRLSITETNARKRFERVRKKLAKEEIYEKIKFSR